MIAPTAFFEAILGLPLCEGGAVVLSPLRHKPCPPFANPFAAMELVCDDGTWRSLSPELAGREQEQLSALGPVMVWQVFALPQGWQPRIDVRGTQRLQGQLPVLGSARLPEGPAFGIECGGRIVSWAAAKAVCGAHNITVETAPAYRKRGFAALCLTAVTDHILREGSVPLYACRPDNGASYSTALRAGYRPYGLWRMVESADMEEEPHATL